MGSKQWASESVCIPVYVLANSHSVNAFSLPPPPSLVMLPFIIYSLSCIPHHLCKLKDEDPEKQQVLRPPGTHRQV